MGYRKTAQHIIGALPNLYETNQLCPLLLDADRFQQNKLNSIFPSHYRCSHNVFLGME